MKKNTLILVSIILLGLHSCTKESKQEIALDTREPYLTQITEVKGNETVLTTFTYNEKKYLSSSKTGNELTTYTYTEDKLTGISIENGAVNTVSEITYKDNYPVKGVSKIYVSGELKRTLNYDYMSSLSQTGQINIYEIGVSTTRHYYEYDNANIISQVEISNRTFTNYDFEYGEKKNVFFNASIRWPLAIGKFDRVSTNEILTIKTERAGLKHQKSFNYTYNSDGMPMSAIVTDTDPPSRMEYKSTITYTYEYL
jgi:hypothetical protein